MDGCRVGEIRSFKLKNHLNDLIMSITLFRRMSDEVKKVDIIIFFFSRTLKGND